MSDHIPAEIVQTEITKALLVYAQESVGELSHLVADKLKYLRWRSAVKTLDKAKKIAEPFGGLQKVPPLKFFLPFMETCSLEEDDEDIIDMWSNLLVAASIGFNSGHLLFMRILKEITGSEARLLRDIAHGGRTGPVSASALDDAIANWQMFSAPASPLRKIQISSWENAKNIVFNELQTPGVAIEHLGLYGCKGPPKEEYEAIYAKETIFYEHAQISLDILVSLNLVEKLDQEYYQDGGEYMLEGTAYCMTAMGAAFYSECVRQDIKKESPAS